MLREVQLMPWTYDDPPDVALNWNREEIRACVDAANAVLAEGGTDEEAIYACINAAGKEKAMELKKKTFTAPIVLKADDEGAFRSVFATFNEIDHDKDVTVPGAFQDGQEVVIEGWNHDYGLPPGKGVIRSNDTEVWVEGRFFLDTTPGKDHYLTLKNLEGLEQWSYTFTVEEGKPGEFGGEEVYFLEKLDVWGVAPVTRGAGIGTRTVSLKALGLTEAELAYVKALCKEAEELEQQGAGIVAGASDPESDEGEAGDGKPSGVPPSVLLTEIEIMNLEE